MPEQPRRNPKPRAELPTVAQIAARSSAAMKAMIADIQVKSGGDPFAAMIGDLGKTIIGVPLPSLSLEYGFGNTVLPLEKVLQCYGQKGSCKSAFGFEIMRWFRRLGGIGNLCEHENKLNPDWAASIIGYEDECMGIQFCHSVDNWQERLQAQNQSIRKMMRGTGGRDKGMGKIFPYLQIVDSIMGKPARETQDKIEKDGSAGRAFPLEALSISRFITKYATDMHGWPFLLVCVNHLKVNPGDQGIDKKTRSGGQTIDFQGAFEIELAKVGQAEYARSTINKLTMRWQKNSYGPDKRKIPVNVGWWDEDGPPDAEGHKTRRQVTRFDWDGSTVQLLLGGKGALWTEMRKMTGLVPKTSTTATSKVLGCKEPVAHCVLGRKIHSNPALMRELRNMLGIRVRRVFQPGVDYDRQLRSLKQYLVQTGQLKEADVQPTQS